MAAPPAPPSPARLLPSLHVFGPDDAPNTVELYLDFVCPRSRALFRATIMGPSRDMDGVEMSAGALAVIFGDPKFKTRFKVVVRPFVQGVHLGSKVTHEVALAVLTVAGDQFWSFCNAVFDAQLTSENYFDQRVDDMTPNALRAELITVFNGVLPPNIDEPTIVPRVRILTSQKSNPMSAEIEKSIPQAGSLPICESLKQVIQKSYRNPASAPGVALWNGAIIPEFSPNWGQLEWTTFLMSRLS
ncbi:hypothetical protein EXIGLDRAFT_840456 [Exidia glandulosa HHB12029]|uniref:Thioredoxin-like fold domain-containing protein n=1 Tax=Exidia glandulosa HHB12029 TaxID=1314781 RepID=A0A165ZYG5_EXIGL|nr:hypothetical protein EXIGLDRAFT_840456 [Exidia glandulosa HHB12029]